MTNETTTPASIPSKAVAVDGGCRCGALRFRLTGAPLMEAACHCRGCQLMTGSAFSTTITVPACGFEVTFGTSVVGGIHGPEVTHHHCDHCKSWVFTTPPEQFGFVNVRATLLDDPAWFAPWMETQTAEKLDWALTGATRSFERFPELPDYKQLNAEYQAERHGNAASD